MDETIHQNYSVDDSTKPPSPLDFEKFLPWACYQLEFEFMVIVTRAKQEDYIGAKANSLRPTSKLKSKQKISSRVDMNSDMENTRDISPSSVAKNVVTVEATYDSCDNLVQIKFGNNKKIPRTIIKLIGLIIPYHINLTNIVINNGIDQFVLYEISKILPQSHLTEICLDNTYLKNANYQVLLENNNSINHLSLCRCSIDDVVIEAIAAALIHPFPASKTLSLLNLSSNRISDDGAKFLSTALRSNRHLSYLNISDNMLSDTGAAYILDTLIDFPLCIAELLASKSRYVTYLKEKNELAIRIEKELREGDSDKPPIKTSKKPNNKSVVKKNKIEKEMSLKSMPESKSITNMDILDKATVLAENTLGEFKDSFSKTNIYVKNSIVNCFGNNTLCYLNLAYNNLTYNTVKKMLYVLLYQKKQNRKPVGLINISLEGNCIPVSCEELISIDQVISEGLMLNQRSLSQRRKTATKAPK